MIPRSVLCCSWWFFVKFSLFVTVGSLLPLVLSENFSVCHGLAWSIMVYHGLSWSFVVRHGLCFVALGGSFVKFSLCVTCCSWWSLKLSTAPGMEPRTPYIQFFSITPFPLSSNRYGVPAALPLLHLFFLPHFAS